MEQTSQVIPVLCPACHAVNRVDIERPEQPVCGRCKATLEPRAPGYPLEADDRSFESSVCRAGLPVLVDFWATWCGPCHQFDPILKDFAAEYAGKIRVVKVNFDKARMTVRKYGVQAIPCLILFRGIEAGRVSGALPPEALRKFVGRFVAAE
jgi:thioredoxin 2